MLAQLKNNRGIALAVVIMIMAILLSITGASLLFSSLNIKTASNLKTAGGAIYAADAGIQHALALIPNGTNFTYGSGATLVPFTLFPTPVSDYSYVVTATNNPSTSASTSTATLTSVATGPNGSKRVVEAYIGRSSSSWVPPGAIYNPGPSNELEFRIRGSAIISGNDTNIDGQPGPLTSISAIATTDPATSAEVIAAIETPAHVTGSGSAPSVAVVSSALDVDALANNFLALTHTVVSGSTLENSTLGSWASPQITRITGDARFRGTSSGAGVLIIDGELRIEDQFDFKGLIILRAGGELKIQMASANATIYGAVLIAPAPYDADTEVEIEGGGAIRFSSEAISKVDATWPGVLPQKARLIAWHEVMQ